MKLFKRLFCEHEYKTITNIHGDARNTFNCCSIKECTLCGKRQKSDELDDTCEYVNFVKRSVK